MIASVTDTIVAALVSSGVVGALVALIKWRPEAGSVAVGTADKAVKVLGGVLTQLEEENKRLAARIADLERTMNERIAAIETDRNALLAENARLRQRVKHLEDRLRGYAPEGNGS